MKCKKVLKRLHNGDSQDKRVLKHLENCDECKAMADLLDLAKASMKESAHDKDNRSLQMALATMREMENPTLVERVKELVLHPIPAYQVAVVMLLLFIGTFIGTRTTHISPIAKTSYTKQPNAEIIVPTNTTSQLSSWQQSGPNIGVSNQEDSLLVLVREIVNK